VWCAANVYTQNVQFSAILWRGQFPSFRVTEQVENE
jgi:hypothetical protein